MQAATVNVDASAGTAVRTSKNEPSSNNSSNQNKRKDLEKASPQNSPSNDHHASKKARIPSGAVSLLAADGLLPRSFPSKAAEVIQLDSDHSSSDSGAESDVEVLLARRVALEGGEYDKAETAEDDEITVPIKNIQLSSVNIEKHVVRGFNSAFVRLQKDQEITAIGQYDLCVKRGVINVMGAKLTSLTGQSHRVYAPSTHSLPSIRCVAIDHRVGHCLIELHSCHSRLPTLNRVSLHFRSIWNSESSKSSNGSFSFLQMSEDDPRKRPLNALQIDPSWKRIVDDLSHQPRQILACGPKNTGKSTFNKYLMNHLLSDSVDGNGTTKSGGLSTKPGVAYLDLDPGQPEFAPSGSVYLAHITSPFFGPSFTHPSLAPPGGRMLRCHYLGNTNPATDLQYFIDAATDLLQVYRTFRMSNPQCSLIINYPGWVAATGLEALTTILKIFGVSDVIYLKHRATNIEETFRPLTRLSLQLKFRLTELAASPVSHVQRHPKHLREMQVLSYYHSSHVGNNPLWSAQPLNTRLPLKVNYKIGLPGIYGILVLGSDVNPRFVYEALEGSQVAIVVWRETHDAQLRLAGGSGQTGDHDGNGNRAEGMDSVDPDTSHEIVEDESTGLPLLKFNRDSASNPLTPHTTHCIGQVIVRSIDVKSHQLELVTPLQPSELLKSLTEELPYAEHTKHSDVRVILVLGTCESEWAYSEDWVAAKGIERRERLRANNNPPQPEIDAAILRDMKWAGNMPWISVKDELRGPSHKPSLYALSRSGMLFNNDHEMD